jgi:hypothetical protein
MTLRLGILAFAVASLAGASSPAQASECKCRAPGKAVELGETACLATPKGPRLATCGIVLNNTAWQFSETPCVVARVDPGAAAGFARRQFAAQVPGRM